MCKGTKMKANHNEQRRLYTRGDAVSYMCKGTKMKANHNNSGLLETCF